MADFDYLERLIGAKIVWETGPVSATMEFVGGPSDGATLCVFDLPIALEVRRRPIETGVEYIYSPLGSVRSGEVLGIYRADYGTFQLVWSPS